MATQINHEHPVIDRAEATCAAAKAKLHRPDGTPVYAEAEYQERLDGLLAQFDATVGPVVERIREEADAIDREVRLARREPVERLPAAELEKAAARRAFIAEDAEHLSLEDLADRLRLEIEAGDKVGKVLWHRYARIRLGAEQARGTDDATLRGLSGALRALDGELADKTIADKEETARQKRREAARVRMAAHLARGRLDGSAKREEALMRARYRL